MSDSIITSDNMSLPIPVASESPGPDYALDVNASLLTIDAHDHSPGNGVRIGPAGININADLAFLNNNAISLRSARFQAQNAPLSAAADYKCLNVSGVDLYYLDGNGNSVRITQSGAVAGSPGSIGSLTPPASVTYVSATPAYVFQSDSNIAANLDGGSLVIRKLTASSAGITISAPTGLASDYTIKLPAALPGSQLLLQLDNTGQISASNTTASGIKIGSSGPTLSYNSSLDALNCDKAIQIGTTSFAAISSLGDDRTLVVSNAAGTNSRPIVVSPTPANNHGLMTIRGLITSGAKVIGEGFTSSASSTGVYDIVYTNAFAAVPVITLGLQNPTATSITLCITANGGSGFTVISYNSSGTPVSATINFIVMGERPA